MDAITNLHQRASIPAKFLVEPAPTDGDRQAILQAAVSAPDHKALRPWRFVVIEGAARNALGAEFAKALVQREPAATAAEIERQREKPLRSPLLIVVVAKIVPDNPKVPVFEQLLSAGAAAEHMQLAAQALGYGSVWVTGPNALDDHVKSVLGVGASDQIVGFLHMGTPSIPPPAINRPDPAQFVEYWQGPR